MSRTDAHTPYRVVVGEPHPSNDERMPLYINTPEYLAYRNNSANWNWHELNKCWSRVEREGSWGHAERRREGRKVRYSARAQVRDEYAAMLDDQDADLLMDCYDY